DKIICGLEEILHDMETGILVCDPSSEDIHTFVESELIKRIGVAGKSLHTARSRNDQAAVDLRMYVKEEITQTVTLLKLLCKVIADKAELYSMDIMPGYTHTQRAQPITFGYHLISYAMMFLRDIDRCNDAYDRMDVSPLGACAFAGTSYPIDRSMTAKELGFDHASENSMDAVSDRDYVLETAFINSAIMMHLSRFAEEMILWSSWEYKFIEISDGYSTGSSIMPQKKNPDMCELVRGKSGRVFGDLMSLLTMMKGLPQAYNKDMQEDKEAIFDSIDTVKICLMVFSGMLGSITIFKDNMKTAAKKGFINATDCADYLTGKGIPFREAYRITGELVAACIKNGTTLEELSLDQYKKHSTLFENDIYDAVDLGKCVEKRTSKGGTGGIAVKEQILYVREKLLNV
ncbi:MAG: argininosuccinate lyase, partial [Clostridia bacterium]